MKLTIGSLFQKHPSNAFVVCVAATVPQGNGAAPVDFHWEEVAPSRKLRQLWDVSGKGILAQSGYLNFYKAQLRNGQDSILATFGRIVRQAKDAGKTHIVLCCYEGSDRFCHRHYLKTWLMAQMKDPAALAHIRKASGDTEASPAPEASSPDKTPLEAVLDAAEALVDSRGVHVEGCVPLKNALAAYHEQERQAEAQPAAPEAPPTSEVPSPQELTPQQKAALTRKRNAALKAAEAEAKAATPEAATAAV